MKVKLLKSHKHSGVDYAVGDLLDVDKDTAEWLANLKVATPAGTDTLAPTQGAEKHSRKGQQVVQPAPSEPSVGVTESGEMPTEA